MSNPSLDAHINRCSDCQAALDDLAREQSATTGQGAARVPAAEELPRIAGFEIERELGRGGMGVVYLAREIKPDRTVAVKFLPSGPFASLRDRERWLKEARAAARVRHPHIVHLHRVDEAGGWLYLVLEYLSGGSLKDRLTGPLTPRLAAKLLVPIAEALEELHRAGVWHLDLKPANILIDAAPGTPLDRAPLKLTDFGIARSCEDLDPTGSSRGAAQGTLLYMAPEQVAGRLSAFGPATDIHAMGSILYELLTGRPPFLADSDAETMQQVQTREPVPPRRLNPKVSRDLETICQKCLEKDPGRRYASAAELAGDLERFLNGKPISARPVSLLEKSWRLCLRRPAIASLVSALILTLGCGFVGLFTLWRRAEAERARVVVERGLAESARLLAEKNEKLATRTLNEFSDVLYRILEKPDSLPEARITELVYFLKQRTADSVSCRAEGPWNAPGVGVLEWVLARKLFSRGKRQEARSLVADSVAYLRECHRLEPDDQNTLWQLGQSLLASGQLAAEDSAFEEALAFYDEASSLSGTLKMLSNRLELVNEVHEVRRLLAVQLATRGDWQQVQRVEQSDHWLLLSIGYANTNEPESKLHVAWTLEELETAKRTIERLRTSLGNSSEFSRFSREADRYMTNLRTSAVQPISITMDLLGGSSSGENLEAWVESLVSSMQSRCTALGLEECAVPSITFNTLNTVTNIAALHRRMLRQREADLTVARLLTFARRLVQHYPGQAESHMVLSEAYVQLSKNAWKRDDYPAIERALRQALESARHAVRLNPQSENARHCVDRLLPRMALFDNGHSKQK